MKKYLPFIAFTFIVLSSSCAHKRYTSSYFEQQTARHRMIAVLPAEMIFTGTKPKNVSEEDLARIEEVESKIFQASLQNGILRHANTRRYETWVGVQDISTTLRLLEENNISIRDSWKEDDRKLAQLLGVDAVVRMRVQKKRYMSDLASLGISVGRQVLSQIGNGGFPLPYVSNKTNDIFVSCNVVSNSQTLWNDTYARGTTHNRPSEEVINEITDNFGRNFPYKKRRS
ncbi:MAG TPA: hypothetical protein VEB42_16560 [Chitinophagaceae bacterium]|nr:hypothetical protein [Chitinophagaceae bacterium]